MSAVATPIPVMRIIRTALRELWVRRGGIVRTVALYFVIGSALMLASTFAGELGGGFLLLLGGLVLLVGSFAAYVSYVRHLILGEALDRAAPVNGALLRLVLRSMVVGILAILLVALLSTVPALVAVLALEGADADPSSAPFAFAAIPAVAAVAVVTIFARLVPYPTAAALGRLEVGLRAVWEATRGHTLRLVGLLLGGAVVGILLGLPLLLAEGLARALLGPETVLGDLIGAFVQFPGAVFQAGVSAELWRHLFPGAASSAPPP